MSPSPGFPKRLTSTFIVLVYHVLFLPCFFPIHFMFEIFSDVDYIDRSFGFESSVEAAQVAIRSAKTEAICNKPNGIGVGTSLVMQYQWYIWSTQIRTNLSGMHNDSEIDGSFSWISCRYVDFE
jgi:hypothetical protein